MNIVIPMAGRGSRLASHQSALPKPLIEVGGRPLWEWATRCLPIESASQLVFIYLRQQEDEFGLSLRLRAAFPESDVRTVLLTGVTDGQLRTVFASKQVLRRDAPILIFNADTWFVHNPDEFRVAAAQYAGVLGVAERPGHHWSFVRTGNDGRVVEVAEKRRIANLASTGLYYFADTSKFLRDAATMFRSGRTVNGEYFVAPLYQQMLDRGDALVTVRATEFYPIGTPAELTEFEQRMQYGPR